MGQDSQDKNIPNDEQAVEQQVEQLLGPPPQDPQQPQPKPEPTPAPPPPAPLPIPDDIPEDAAEPKEKPLVIPEKETDAPEVTAEVTDLQAKPLAGDTVAPSTADSKEAANVAANGGAQHNKFKRFWHKWWRTPLYRHLTVAAIFVFLIGIVLFPTTRYFILNTAGVRSSASLTVLDNSTSLPLKNVQVSLGGQSATTNEDGQVRLQHIKLGRGQLDIEKRAFAPLKQTVTIGWGSNPLGNYSVNPTGSQYVIYVKDWLTGKTLAGGSASGGGADANADLNGKILLTIDTTTAQADSLKITVHADNYRDQDLTLDLANPEPRTANMVISRKNVYVTNESGKYDVYSVDIDGLNKKLVLAGTGLEKNDLVLVQHPTDDEAALVSTRVNAKNSDGFLLNTLTLINLKDNTTQAIAQSEQVQIVGWAGSRLVFVQITAGASANDPQRFKLVSYDYKTGDKKELASANSFNDVLLDGSTVYYAPASLDKKDPNSGLIQSNVDGTNKKTLIQDEVWNIFRVNHDSLNLATDKNWYEYTLGSIKSPTILSQKPSNPDNRLYITSPDGKNSLWVDQRDGKGVLINYDTTAKTDQTLETKDGLIYPVKWLSNEVFVFRVKSDTETADYVMDVTGGKAHKVVDLFNAPGIDRWYYY